jgi:hypothetical protein
MARPAAEEVSVPSIFTPVSGSTHHEYPVLPLLWSRLKLPMASHFGLVIPTGPIGPAFKVLAKA